MWLLLTFIDHIVKEEPSGRTKRRNYMGEYLVKSGSSWGHENRGDGQEGGGGTAQQRTTYTVVFCSLSRAFLPPTPSMENVHELFTLK